MKEGAIAQQLYVIFDVRSRTIIPPLMNSPNDVNPIREITRAVNTQADAGRSNMLAEHAEDFQLMRIGIIDMETGEIDPQKPQLVTELSALKR